MKSKLLKVLVAGTAVFIIALNSGAATSKEKLINSLYKEQKATEERIVKLWMTGKRGKELETELAGYVAREVRLQAMTGKMNTKTLFAKVATEGNEFENPLELARAIVVEHLKNKNIDIDNCGNVQGEYLIRKSCLE